MISFASLPDAVSVLLQGRLEFSEVALFESSSSGLVHQIASLACCVAQSLRNSETSRSEGTMASARRKDVALGWCEAEPVVSEAEWLPLISDALATAKHGKAVGPDALPAEHLKAGGTWLLPYPARLAALATTAGVPKGWRGGRMALVPKKAMLPFSLQNSRRVPCAWRARSWPRWCARSWLGLWQRRQVRASMEPYREGALRRPAAVLFTDLCSSQVGPGRYSLLAKEGSGLWCAGHRRRAESPLGRGDQVRRHHHQAVECCGVLAQDGSGLPQGPLVLGFRLAEASSHFCWHSDGRSLGGRGVRTDLSGVSREPGAHPNASPGERASSSTMWWYLRLGELVQETLPCPTHVDDLAILLEADSYQALLARLATVTEGTVRIASDFGLQLNLAPATLGQLSGIDASAQDALGR